MLEAKPPALPESVAVMIGQLGTGGSERQLNFFLKHCDRSRWAPVVYVSGILGKWADEFQAMGIPVVLLRGNRLQKLRQFRAACVAQGARCFFSWSSYTNAYGLALMGLGVRRLGSFRNASFADLPEQLRTAWSYLSVAGVSTIVCNSRETRDDLAAKYRGKRVVYMPNVVEFFEPERGAAWRKEWRIRLGVSDEAILILGAGRLAPQKNFARFIEVVASVNKDVPVQAVIAGDDFGCLSDLQKRVNDLGLQETVRFAGRVPDARELMSAADIFFLSSDYEGMPNVVLEAMSAGTPCVSTAVNGIRELITHGVNGYVGADTDELARYLKRLAVDGDLRGEMGQAARASVARFGPGRVVPELWWLCEPSHNGDLESAPVVKRLPGSEMGQRLGKLREETEE